MESGRGPWLSTRHLGKSGASLGPPGQQPTMHTVLIGHFQAIRQIDQ